MFPGEAFRFFHSLILLVKGSLVYFGPLYGENGAAQYFEGLGFPYDFDDNLADHLIAITGEEKEQSCVLLGFRSGSGSSLNR